VNLLRRFAAAGTVGFLVDAGILLALVEIAGVNAIGGRFISFSAAVTCTYFLNRALTFRDAAAQPAIRQWSRYFTVNGVGALINLAVYIFLVKAMPMMGQNPVVPLAFAAVVALMFNYFALRKLVFNVSG
jgi:putative flippase GtrA